jgi:hypothetical protein
MENRITSGCVGCASLFAGAFIVFVVFAALNMPEKVDSVRMRGQITVSGQSICLYDPVIEIRPSGHDPIEVTFDSATVRGDGSTCTLLVNLMVPDVPTYSVYGPEGNVSVLSRSQIAEDRDGTTELVFRLSW